MPNQHPVVFVHGLFGFGPKELGPLKYWGRAFDVESPIAQRFEASVGPVASAHDRACELAAQIMGTRVDYGAAHAAEFGHDRFGDDFTGQGFLPDWSESNPVHLVGHSHGAPTIRCLQHLLETDHWGWGSTHRWVRSITAISGVLNGSTLVFGFGADEATGLMHRDGLCSVLLRLVELYTGATTDLIRLDDIYDFDLDHWGYRRRDGETMQDYLARVSQSPFLWGKDNAAYALTLQGAYEDNAVWKTYPDTHYFSHVTEKTWRDPTSGFSHPSPDMLSGMHLASEYIGTKLFDRPPIPVEEFASADWWENDGLVPTFSQRYPHTAGAHPVGREFDAETPVGSLPPGRWHVNWLRGMDHLEIGPVLSPLTVARQEDFYRDLLRRLAALPEADPAP